MALKYLARLDVASSFGVIYKSLFSSDDGDSKVVAVKRNTRYETCRGFEGVRELDALMHLREPSDGSAVTYCIRLLFITNDKIWADNRPLSPHRKGKGIRDDHIHYVFPWAVNDLSKRCKDRSRPLSNEQVMAFTMQCAYAIFAVHERGMLHRDIKPGNFFILENNGVESVRLGDFGGCVHLDDESELTHHNIGTQAYRSPEVLFGIDYGHAYDVWGLGCVFYSVAHGGTHYIDHRGRFNPKSGDVNHRTIMKIIACHPFAGRNTWLNYMESLPESNSIVRNVLDEMENLKFTQSKWSFDDASMENSLGDLVSKMLHPDPNLRIDIGDVCAHRFFAPIRRSYPQPSIPVTKFYVPQDRKVRSNIIRMSMEMEDGHTYTRTFFHVVEIGFRIYCTENEMPSKHDLIVARVIIRRILGCCDGRNSREKKLSRTVKAQDEYELIHRLSCMVYCVTLFELTGEIDASMEDIVTFLYDYESETEICAQDDYILAFNKSLA